LPFTEQEDSEVHYISFDEELKKDIDKLKDNLDKHYRIFYFKKKRGGKRKITAPDDDLKSVQKRILKFLLDAGIESVFSSDVTGFRTKHTLVDNAMHHSKMITYSSASMAYAEVKLKLPKSHVPDSQAYATRVKKYHKKHYHFLDLTQEKTKATYFPLVRQLSPQNAICMDIKDAFGSVTQELLREGLTGIDIQLVKEDVDRLVAIGTYKGSLPQGAPTSPLLMNLALHPFDVYLTKLIFSKLNERFNVTFRYSRFADDIVISTYSKGMACKCIPFVKSVGKVFGLRMHPKKTKIMGRKNGIFVTGINIVNSASHISVSRKTRNKIRAAIHQAKGLKDVALAKAKASILGRISHVLNIDTIHGTKLAIYAWENELLEDHEKICGQTIESLIYSTLPQKTSREKIFK
jgi:hypothetical protein